MAPVALATPPAGARRAAAADDIGRASPEKVDKAFAAMVGRISRQRSAPASRALLRGRGDRAEPLMKRWAEDVRNDEVAATRWEAVVEAHLFQAPEPPAIAAPASPSTEAAAQGRPQRQRQPASSPRPPPQPAHPIAPPPPLPAEIVLQEEQRSRREAWEPGQRQAPGPPQLRARRQRHARHRSSDAGGAASGPTGGNDSAQSCPGSSVGSTSAGGSGAAASQPSAGMPPPRGAGGFLFGGCFGRPVAALWRGAGAWRAAAQCGEPKQAWAAEGARLPRRAEARTWTPWLPMRRPRPAAVDAGPPASPAGAATTATELVAEVEAALQSSRGMSAAERRKVFRELQRKLHPDKNLDNVESATVAFQRLMDCRRCFV